MTGHTPFVNQSPVTFYSKPVNYPDYFDPLAKDLVSRYIDLFIKRLTLRLLIVQPEFRLGANGIQEVKAHPWFTTHPCFDWELLKQKKEPAPLIPKIPPNNPLANYTEDVGFSGNYSSSFLR